MPQTPFDLLLDRAAHRVLLAVLAALLALPVAEGASPAAAGNRARTVTRTFANPERIALSFGTPPPISARLYPSAIEVGGLRRARIRDVNVRLRGFEHNDPNVVEVLLVGPDGQTAVAMANVGGLEEVEDVALTLDDEAAAPLPDSAAHLATTSLTHVCIHVWQSDG